jgi:hypothetical protein
MKKFLIVQIGTGGSCAAPTVFVSTDTNWKAETINEPTSATQVKTLTGFLRIVIRASTLE